MAEKPIRLERDGAVATLVLNRPDKHNAMTLAMWDLLPALLEDVASDVGIKALVLRGAGESAFSSGADIGEFARIYETPSLGEDLAQTVDQALSRLQGLAKPTVAMIRGVCVGGGCALALACDLRFAAVGSRFGITPAKLGLAYSLADTRRLVHVVGPSIAKDLLFSGRLLDGEEALRVGLIDRLVPPAALAEETLGFLGTVCSRSQYSVRAAKAIVRAILDGATDETPTTSRLLTGSFTNEDFQEGYRAFLEKRPPSFSWT